MSYHVIDPVFLRCTIVVWVWKLQVGAPLQRRHLIRLFASLTEAIYIIIPANQIYVDLGGNPQLTL